ncbi:4031_t:CDS:1 [Funneliformis mosseae]|uniref:4031_t:CDS:1 n=1 Tax=Funneliformis mosseae TaxID=27381 RepID=A0A9N9FQ09_FUNMO|nr:4031_t:CDS:1 [Funneliformis mosseae]
MNNIQRELSYISKDLTESELRESVNITSVSSIIGLEDKDEIANISNDNLGLRFFSSTELDIGNIVDLKININDINEKKESDTISIQIQPPDLADLIYDPSDILNRFLEYERH